MTHFRFKTIRFLLLLMDVPTSNCKDILKFHKQGAFPSISSDIVPEQWL